MFEDDLEQAYLDWHEAVMTDSAQETLDLRFDRIERVWDSSGGTESDMREWFKKRVARSMGEYIPKGTNG